MKTVNGAITRYLVIFWILICLLGIVGIFAVFPNTTGEAASKESKSLTSENNSFGTGSSRGSRGGTEIAGTLQLWDTGTDEPHEGTYKYDNYGNEFYLKSSHLFKLYIKNIGSNYVQNVVTQLKVTSSSGYIVTITNSYYNKSYMSVDYYYYFYYNFKIDTDAEIEAYELALYVEFEIVEGSETSDMSGTMFFKIQLASRVKMSNHETLKLYEMSEGYKDKIYSGTQNQLIGLPNTYSASGTIKDVTLILGFTSNFNFDENKAYLDELKYYSTGGNPQWILTNAGSLALKPQDYHGTLDITYKLVDDTIKENNVQVILEVAETPIIYFSGQIAESQIGLLSGNKVGSNFEIYQGSTSNTFLMSFENKGNVDLKDVEVELFTDNAAYFFKSTYYYDENNYAYKRSYGNTVVLGDVAVGKSVTKDFSTEVLKNLPPGLYRIPIKYEAKYNSGGLIDVDVDVNDEHEAILAARSTANEGYTPFVLVYVQEGEDQNDNTEPDLLAISSTPLQVGKHNVLLSVELTNLENYQLKNVNAQINVGGTSPLEEVNQVDRTAKKINAQEKDFTMYGANDAVFSNKFTVQFLVDIYEEAIPGVNDVPITITCLDPFNQERTTKVNVQLNLNPVPPRFVVSSITADDIKPNEMFKLTVKVYNCGGSQADNVKLLFNGSTNLFSAENNIVGPKGVYKDQEVEFEFEINTGEVEPGKIYKSSVFISFKDSLGNEYPFDSNPEQIISLHVKEKKEVKDFWDINVGLALVLLGLFVLISALIFGVIRSRISKKEHAAEVGEPLTSGPQQPEKKERKKAGRLFKKKEKDLDYRGGPGSPTTYYPPSPQQQPPQQQPPQQQPPPHQPPPHQPPPHQPPPHQPPPSPQYQYQPSYQSSPGWQNQNAASPPPPHQPPPPGQRPYQPQPRQRYY